MRLLDPQMYEPVFAPLRGKKIGYVRNASGNVGDTIQERAVFQLAGLLGVQLRRLKSGRYDGVDELVCHGGGNMGLPGPSMRRRKAALASGLPMTIFPNSWRAPEPLPERVKLWARERKSIELYEPRARLAPDLGLAFDFDPSWRERKPTEGVGVYLRNDKEARFADALPDTNRGPAFSGIEPRDVAGYFLRALRYTKIITDALHFAVVGLMMAREVYLLPGQYTKNVGMYEAWLRDLGCRWAESPEDAL